MFHSSIQSGVCWSAVCRIERFEDTISLIRTGLATTGLTVSVGSGGSVVWLPVVVGMTAMSSGSRPWPEKA
jgi:hypothetical protein